MARKCDGKKCSGRDAEFVIVEEGPDGSTNMVFSCRPCALWTFDRGLGQLKRMRGRMSRATFMSLETWEDIAKRAEQAAEILLEAAVGEDDGA